MKIAFQGEEGSFTEEAIIKQFSDNCEKIACKELSEVFKKVEDNECDYAVIPIENSIEGTITESYDLLLESKLKMLVSKLDQLESSYKKINEDNSKLEVSIAIKNYQLKKQTIQSSFSSKNFNTDQKENKKIKEKIDSTIIEIEELINNLN